MSMAKLIIGVMYSDENLMEEVKGKLKEKFGEVEGEIRYGFSFTRYYEEEMGKNLKKNILAFKQPIRKERLSEIKDYTDELEDEYRIKGKRRVNIDPGYLTEEEFMLASHKKSPYKAGVGGNVYAHLTLKFENGKYVITPRTYPDFKIKKVQEFLITQLRKLP